MPSRALTVTLNFDQSRKFVLLLPESPESRGKLKERILRESKNKFRAKGVSSVFLQGGTTLEDDAELPELTSQVWVGKGEPYAGPPRVADDVSGARPQNIRIIAWVLFSST